VAEPCTASELARPDYVTAPFSSVSSRSDGSQSSASCIGSPPPGAAAQYRSRVPWWLWLLIAIAAQLVAERLARRTLPCRLPDDAATGRVGRFVGVLLGRGGAVHSRERRRIARFEAAVREALSPGYLLFRPPESMTQGRTERVEAGIARQARDLPQLLSGMLADEPRADQIRTGPIMTVALRGPAFEIAALSPATQAVTPSARWQFDVTPLHAGTRMLTLTASIQVLAPGPAAEVGGPIFDRTITVQVNRIYAGKRFAAANWQWLAVTAAGLGGAITAWIKLF
jgi:hypothetical protein